LIIWPDESDRWVSPERKARPIYFVQSFALLNETLLMAG
jgi:hypothetical protein